MIKRFLKINLAVALTAVLFSCEKDAGTVSVSGVALNDEAVALYVGEVYTLEAVVMPENAADTALIWSSDNADVAVVDAGVVTAVAEGSAVITVETVDGGYTDVCNVEVYVPVSEISLDQESALIEVGESLTLTALLQPEGVDAEILWTSSDESVASVEDGVVTALASGEITITASVNGGALTAECQVMTGLGMISFRTDRTWEIGSQIWSDAVMATRADKDDFYGGTPGSTDYVIDCLQNGEYGDWFSWMAVITYQDEMCPDGWRVPTRDDFIALDIALGGDGTNKMLDNGITRYIDEWGGEYGGYVWYYEDQIQFSEVGSYAAYWSQTESSETQGCTLNLGGSHGYRTPRGSGDKYNGFTVRCVKDK